jgi:hypothetical protein
MPVQRPALQRRAVENERAVGTKSLSKMPSISWREARPLQAPVGWQLGRAALAMLQPVFEYGNFVGSAQQLIRFVQECQRHDRHLDVVKCNPDFEAIHIHDWLPASVREPMLHVANNLDLNAVDFQRAKVRLYAAGAGKADPAFLVHSENRLKRIGVRRSCAKIDVVNRNRDILQGQRATAGNCPGDRCWAKLVSNRTKNSKQWLWNAHILRLSRLTQS